MISSRSSYRIPGKLDNALKGMWLNGVTIERSGSFLPNSSRGCTAAVQRELYEVRSLVTRVPTDTRDYENIGSWCKRWYDEKTACCCQHRNISDSCGQSKISRIEFPQHCHDTLRSKTLFWDYLRTKNTTMEPSIKENKYYFRHEDIDLYGSVTIVRAIVFKIIQLLKRYRR